jgi:hypothetical protein
MKKRDFLLGVGAAFAAGFLAKSYLDNRKKNKSDSSDKKASVDGENSYDEDDDWFYELDHNPDKDKKTDNSCPKEDNSCSGEDDWDDDDWEEDYDLPPYEEEEDWGEEEWISPSPVGPAKAVSHSPKETPLIGEKGLASISFREPSFTLSATKEKDSKQNGFEQKDEDDWIFSTFGDESKSSINAKSSPEKENDIYQEEIPIYNMVFTTKYPAKDNEKLISAKGHILYIPKRAIELLSVLAPESVTKIVIKGDNTKVNSSVGMDKRTRRLLNEAVKRRKDKIEAEKAKQKQETPKKQQNTTSKKKKNKK